MLFQLIIIQAFTVGAIFLILRFILQRQLNASLSRLNALYEENLVKEEQLKEELERARQATIIEIKKGKQEAESLIEAGRKDAEKIRENLIKQAREDAQRIIQQGQDELNRLKNSLGSEIENKAVVLSLKLIEYIFTQESRQNLQHQMMEELFHEVRNLPSEKFLVSVDKAKVASPFSLSAAELGQLQQLLGEKTGKNISIEQEISPNLIAGIFIQLGELVIDATLSNKLQKAIPYLKNEI